MRTEKKHREMNGYAARKCVSRAETELYANARAHNTERKRE